MDFAELVKTAPAANARMTADIDLGNNLTMVGTSSVAYQGVFDGQGKTLTVNYSCSIGGIAPFQYVGAATIMNLHVDGRIATSACAAGGIAGGIKGSLTVSNCWVSASISAATSGDARGTIGGIASYCNTYYCDILIADCLFTGAITNNTEYCAGFMSNLGSNTHATMRNCLNAGTFPTSTSGCGTFSRDTYYCTLENCLYKTAFGSAQGTLATAEQLADGTTAAALQDGREATVWVQDTLSGQPILATFYTAPDEFAGYVKIGDVAGFEAIANNLATNYVLMADIDLQNVERQPFGTFSGVLDGNGHAIRNLNIKRNDSKCALFSYLNGATIRNLTLQDGKIEIEGNNSDAAGIAGCVQNGALIEDCTVDGLEIISKNLTAGGFVGYAESGNLIIRRCRSLALITANGSNSAAGGFVGYTDANVQIEDCYYSGVITAGRYAGGIVGQKYNGTIAISNCYHNSCLYPDTNNDRKLVGNGDNQATITGNPTVIDAFHTGGVRVKAYGAGTGTASYDTTTGEIVATPAAGSFYAGYIGMIPEGEFNDVTVWAVFGKEIATVGEFNAITNNLAGVYKLTADIDLQNVERQPFGEFSGVFDGNGHAVRNISITKGSDTNIGLFSLLNGATIRNLTLDGGRIEGYDNVGGIAGKILGDTLIENCSVNIVVFGNRYTIGGFVGYADGGNVTIRRCRSFADVTSVSGESGGLVGSTNSDNLRIEDSYAEGILVARNQTYCGGATGYSGGLVGLKDNSGSLAISNCYHRATMVDNGFNDRQLVGNGDDKATITGVPSADADLTSGVPFEGWDTTVWKFTEGLYPRLRVFIPQYTVTWLDEDGVTVLDEAQVDEFDTPVYGGVTPTKAETAEYTYTFAGWAPAVAAVESNTTYTATFNATKRSYTITWLNDDGSLIDTTTVAYGETPTHADATKAETAEYTYTFAGWSPAVVAVTGAATYTATFDATPKSSGATVDVSTLANGDIVQNGSVLTGTAPNLNLKVAAGATITLDGVCITNSASNVSVLHCLGDATIILAPGSENTVRGAVARYCTGNAIYVPTNSTLTIRGSGSLYADSSSSEFRSAAIGAFAYPYNSDYVFPCGDIVIEGGTITAKGGVGIGASGNGGYCGNITITGDANVTAIATVNGSAGIGAAGTNGNCGDITISGNAKVTATGNYNAPGIGAADHSTCGDIVIATTGTVMATGNYFAPGIGACGAYEECKCGNITIADTITEVVAQGQNDALGIYTTSPSEFTYGSHLELVTSDGNRRYTLTPVSGGQDGVVDLSALTGNYTAQDGDVLTGATGYEITIAAGATVTLDGVDIACTSGSDPAVTCLGDATIILAEGSANSIDGSATSYAGIFIYSPGSDTTNTLTIAGTGALTVLGGDKSAGIGSNAYNNSGSAGNIVISGGTVTATGGEWAAGIGSGYRGTCGDITITGGTVTANIDTTTSDSYTDTAALGAGCRGECGNILISGGTVTAISVNPQSYNFYDRSCAIGATYSNGRCGNITITDGITSVTATKGATAQQHIGQGDGDATIGTVTISPRLAQTLSNNGLTLTLTPQDVPETVTITWVDEDGTTLATDTVAYSATPTYDGETPTKAEDAQYTYTFDGWIPAVVAATSNTTYTATYTAVEKPVERVIFSEDFEATVLPSCLTMTVRGTFNSAPGIKAGLGTEGSGAFGFGSSTCGSSAFDNYMTTLTLDFGKETYVTRIEFDEMERYGDWGSQGRVLVDGTVVDGLTFTKPGVNTGVADSEFRHTSLTLNRSLTTISLQVHDITTSSEEFIDNLCVYGYGDGTVTVTWRNEDGTVLETDENVELGATPTYDGETPTKASTAEYSYTFSGWTPTVSAVTGAATYTAQFSQTKRSYMVTWVSEGATVASGMVEYGETPSYDGETPTKESTAEYSYAFSGWSPAVAAVTGEATYTAQFEATKRSYTITWVVEGVTVASGAVEYGQTPAYGGETPTKESTAEYSYTFTGWSPTVAAVTGAATYTAQFSQTKRSYTVAWVVEGATVASGAVEYGTVPTYTGETPTKESTAEYSYEFSGWSPAVSAVTGEATYTAQFNATKRSYMVSWVVEGATVASGAVEYGTVPTYTGATPTKESTAEYSYEFTGWTPAIEAVEAETTYTATFTPVKRSYTITWANIDGAGAVATSTVEYGQTPTYGGTPTKADDAENTYAFNGWTPSVVAVTDNATYTATFTATPKEPENPDDPDTPYDGTETINGVVWSYTVANGEATITYAEPAEGDLVIPDTVESDIPVTAIASGAFSGSDVTSVTIGRNVKTIGDAVGVMPDDWNIEENEMFGPAFMDCYDLETFYVAEGNEVFEAIGGCLYYRNTPNDAKTLALYPCGRTNLYFDAGITVTEIGTAACSMCSEFGEITIPASVGRIGVESFYSTMMTKLVVQDGTTNICDRAFCQNPYLMDAEIAGTVKYIGKMVFVHSFFDTEDYDENAIARLVLHEGIEEIDDEAFRFCRRINEVVLPDSLTRLGEYAFCEGEGVKRVVIGNGLETVSEGAFAWCGGLPSLTIGASVKSIENKAFSGCDKLPSLDIPQGVTNIGMSAFSDCETLRTLSLPDTLKTIGSGAFSGCRSLKKLVVPLSVEEIGRGDYDEDLYMDVPGAFAESYALDRIYLPAALRPATEEETNAYLADVFEGRGFDSMDVASRDAIVTWYSDESELNYVTVTFVNGAERTNVQVLDYISTIPSPTKPGYAFAGWWTSEGGMGSLLMKRTSLTRDTTYYAYWIETPVASGDDVPWYAIRSFLDDEEMWMLRSGETALGETSTATLDVTGPCIVSFSCSPAGGAYDEDAVHVYVDGVERDVFGQDDHSWSDRTYEIPQSGAHTVSWVYENVSGDIGGYVYLAGVTVEQAEAHTITFNPRGGAMSESTTRLVVRSVGALPKPRKDYAVFAGWYTAAEGGERIAEDFVVTQNLDLYAHWVDAPFSSGGDRIWLVDDDGSYKSESLDVGETIYAEMTVTGPCRVVFDLKVDTDYWTNNRFEVYVDGEENAGFLNRTSWLSWAIDIEEAGEHVVRWLFEREETGKDGYSNTVALRNIAYGTVYGITFDENYEGGGTQVKDCAGLLGELPVPSRDDYFMFAGWWTQRDGGTQITATTPVTGEATYYAHWTSTPFKFQGKWAQGEDGSWRTTAAGSYESCYAQKDVEGPCTVTFQWRVVDADDRMHLYLTHYLNGDYVDSLIETFASANWTEETFTFDSEGTHTLFFEFWTGERINPSRANRFEIKDFRIVGDEPEEPGEFRILVDENDPTTVTGFEGTCPATITAADWPEGVTYISAGFDGCTTLKHLTLPAGLRSIGWRAFQNCTALETVDFSNCSPTLSEIGVWAFCNCTSLRSLDINGNNLVVGHGAFYACSSLAELNLGSGVDTVEEYAFGACKSLAAITSAAADVNETAFIGTAYYKSMAFSFIVKEDWEGKLFVAGFKGPCPATIAAGDWPEGVETIYDYAFTYCDELRSVEFPASFSRINAGTFAGCKGLESITFPATNEHEDGLEVGHNAFALCTNLQSVTLRGPLNVSMEAFGGCSSLASVVVEEGVNFWGERLFARTGVRSIVLPENMGDVSAGAFAGNDGDFTVYVPRSVVDNYGLEEGIVECDSYMPRVFGLESEERWAEYGFTYQETTTNLRVVPYGDEPEEPETYTVTWLNWDETVLETDENVAAGEMPSYDGETPTKAETAEYTYTFTGWDPAVVVVTGNATYTATFEATPKAHEPHIDLSALTTDHYVVLDGDILTGTTLYHVKIADGATITLAGATINNRLSCEGSATIQLADGTDNFVCPAESGSGGIRIGGSGTTLTIVGGTGTLTAIGDWNSPGIGNAGYRGGNIVIAGGVITATGGEAAPGIGSADGAVNFEIPCGTIEITGGTVVATGGTRGAGIGGDGGWGTTGDITIGGGISRVVATRGERYGANPIFGNGRVDIAANLKRTSSGYTWTLEPMTAADMTWMVVDLRTGAKSYYGYDFDTATNTFNTAEYKTVKMAFRRVPKGEYFVQNGNHVATMANDYYIALFETTKAQYDLMLDPATNVTTSSSTVAKGEVPWTSLRGTTEITPQGVVTNVEGDHAICNLNGLTGLKFDLPTIAMWEVASLAKPTNATVTASWSWFFGPTIDNLAEYAWNDGWTIHEAGLLKPNEWGLYDVYGNVWEWCADGIGSTAMNDQDAFANDWHWNQEPNYEGRDPLSRRCAGGSVCESSEYCNSVIINTARKESGYQYIGFRLAVIVDDETGGGGSGGEEPEPETYTVTWLNWDGTTLEADENVAAGATPSYDGVTPSKAETAEYTYTFTGWDPAVVAVTGNATYTATYTAVPKLPVPFTTGGNAKWKVDVDGSWRSGVISDSQSTWAETNVTGSCLVTFQWKTSSEESFDKLKLLVDDVEKASISGVMGDWREYSIPFADTGTHTIRWTYSKDSSALDGEDCGWVKDFTVTELVALPIRTGGDAEWFVDSNGNWRSGGIDADQTTWAETTVTGPCRVDFQWKTSSEEDYNRLTLIVDGDEYEVISGVMDGWEEKTLKFQDSRNHVIRWSYAKNTYAYESEDCGWVKGFTETPLATYTVTWKNYDGTVLATTSVFEDVVPEYTGATPTKPKDSDWAYVFSGWTPTVVAAAGNAEYTATYTAVPNLPASVITGGSAEWAGDVDGSWRSGAISDRQSTWAETNVTGSCLVTFQWKTSSELDYDMLTLYVDGVEKESISGVMDDWIEYSIPFTDTGTHTIRWTYSKDSSALEGEDCGWVKDFTVTPKEFATYTVTWKNWDDTVLATESVVEGFVPQYRGETPARATDEDYYYTFAGWTPVVASVTGDTIYTATYNAYQARFEMVMDGTTVTGYIGLLPKHITLADWPVGVTAVADDVFSGYSIGDPWIIESVEIPATVETLGQRAFYNAYGLTNLVFEAGGTQPLEINFGVFAFAYALESVTLPARLVSIGDSGFYQCTKLATVVFEGNRDDVTVGRSAFSGTPYYASLPFRMLTDANGVIYAYEGTVPAVIGLGDWPAGATALDDVAVFSGCATLQDVTIPATITKVGWSSFQSCPALTNVVFAAAAQGEDPASLAIGKTAFANCEQLASVTLRDGTVSIGDSAFANDPLLADVTFPTGGQEGIAIEDSAFVNTAYGGTLSFKLVKDGDNNVIGYYGTVPATIGVSDWPAGAAGVDAGVFKGCTTLEHITFPSGIEFIGYETFKDCVNLATVNFANSFDSLTTICGYAFSGCTGLETVELDGDGLYVDRCAFQDCTLLTTLTLGPGVSQVDEFAFAYTTRLEAFVNNSSADIDETAFIGSGYYKNMPFSFITRYDGGLTVIGNTGVCPAQINAGDWPAGIVAIYRMSFTFNDDLRAVEFPASLQRIDESAFACCTNLVSITFPADGSLAIDHNAFALCTKLQNITLRGDLMVCPDAFAGCSSLETVRIEEGVYGLDEGAFARTQVSSIVLPEGMDEVSAHAFAYDDGDFTVYVPRSETSMYGLSNGDVTYEYIPRIFRLETEEGWAQYGLVVKETTTNLRVVPYCRVTLDLAGGTGVATSQLGTGETVNDQFAHPVKAGYTFAGWTSANVAEITSETTWTAIIGSDTGMAAALTATWQAADTPPPTITPNPDNQDEELVVEDVEAESPEKAEEKVEIRPDDSLVQAIREAVEEAYQTFDPVAYAAQYANYFTKTAESTGDGVYSVKVELNPVIVFSEQTVGDNAKNTETLLEVATSDNENQPVEIKSAKPGLYYSMEASNDLTFPSAADATTRGKAELAVTPNVSIKKPTVMPSGNAVFFRIVVSPKK